MSFTLRSIFSGSTSGLRQFLTQFNLAPPASGRLLAASVAIAARYQQTGGFKGPLGVAISPVAPEDPVSHAFVQSYRGGDLHFQDGQTSGDHMKQTTITYKGTHCFGEPGFGKGESVYVIVSVYSPEDGQAQTKKFPDDSGKDVYDDFDQNEDRTAGILDVWKAQPQPVVIQALVMGTSLLGDSQKVKSAVKDAAQQSLDKANSITGQIATPAEIALLSNTFSALFVGLVGILGLTDPVRGAPQAIQFTYEELLALPKPSTQQQGIINFNVASPILTDGDASYKVYFDVDTRSLDPLPSQP